MQGSFEKKVQEKLDELKLTPSAPVWEKIALQIKENKKRRRGLLWFPFFIILFLGAGWWLWQGGSEKSATVPPATVTPSNGPQSSIPDVRKNEQENASTVEKKNEISVSSKMPEQYILPSYNNTTKKSIDQRETAFHTLASKPIVVDKQAQDFEHATIVDKQKKEKSLTQLLNEMIPNSAIVKSNTATPGNPAITEKEEPVDTIVSLKTPLTDSVTKPAIRDTVTAKPKLASLNKKWKFSLSVQAGWSRPAPSLSSAARLDYASPIPSSGSNFSSNYGVPNSSSGGAAYAIGVGLSRDISRRLALSFALQFAAYRTQTKVGTFRPLDTTIRYQSAAVSVSGYYRNGHQQDYTTRSYVLEVPVSLDYKLLRSLPLYLSAGGSYGRLLKSNALTFNRASNLYYENKQNLNSNQFSLFSSLQYGIIHKKGFSLHAGPVAQYQVTSFQKEAGTASQCLLFAGVKTSVEF